MYTRKDKLFRATHKYMSEIQFQIDERKKNSISRVYSSIKKAIIAQLKPTHKTVATIDF